MSTKVEKLVWECGSVKGNRRLVLLALAWWSDEQGLAWPGMAAIADRATVCEKTARNLVRDLEEQGYLTTAIRRGRSHSNLYQINIRKLQENRKVMPILDRINRNKLPVLQPDNRQDLPILEGENRQQNRQNGTVKSAIAVTDDSSIDSSLNYPEDESLKGVDEDARARDRSKFSQASSSSPPDRLSKEYFARRGASASAHSPPEAEPTTIPEGFEITDRMKAWAEGKVVEYGVGLNVQLLADKFLNYYRRGRGKATVQPDWEGCWQDWVIRDIEELEQKGKSNGKAANGLGGHMAANHESKRARAVKERFRERTGAELDEVRFSGVGDEAPDYPGWPGPRR